MNNVIRTQPSVIGATNLPFVPIRTDESHHDANLKTILARIDSLIHLPRMNDPDLVNPTFGVCERAAKLLAESAQYVRGGFPKGFVAPDGDGGIRIRWRQPGREMKLIVPSAGQDEEYIYHDDGTDHAIEKPVNSSTLARWLNWYNAL